jgi:hypothetical protein
LNCPSPAVAVEAQQGPDRAGLVVVIDVCCGSRPADRTDAALVYQHGVCFLGANPVATIQVIRAASAALRNVPLPPSVVAGKAVSGPA